MLTRRLLLFQIMLRCCTLSGAARRHNHRSQDLVYLDGELQASDVDLGLSAMGKNPRGKIRQYGQLIYGIEGLQRGKHVLCIEVCGKPALESHNSYVPIDHFLVLGNGWGDTLFIINQEINYPQLSWACYNKPPIIVESGYTGKVITMMSECPSV